MSSKSFSVILFEFLQFKTTRESQIRSLKRQFLLCKYLEERVELFDCSKIESCFLCEAFNILNSNQTPIIDNDFLGNKYVEIISVSIDFPSCVHRHLFSLLPNFSLLCNEVFFSFKIQLSDRFFIPATRYQ